ncbi:hypothetical protein C8Q80DRAFT_1159777 [Daedaleopsis nitida]|nr:hypothetical protein C8Q80DRAFT_1159777 [Daedaleopsis nitida]
MTRKDKNEWKLRTEDDIQAFVDFVTSSTTNGAFLHIYHLDIGFDPDTILILVVTQLEKLLIANANTLSVKHLSLEDAETMFGEWPKLVDVFAGLTITDRLSIKGVGKRAATMLVNMKSQLKVVNMELEGDKWAAPGDFQSSNPIALLRASQATLQDLTVYGASTYGDGDEVYPATRSLEVSSVDKMYTSDYARAFPGLEYLIVFNGTAFYNEDSSMLSEGAVKLRRENRENQLEYGRWDYLRFVTASLVDVYVLGLRTRVKTLKLLAVSKKCTADMLSTVLQDTSRPSKLDLTTNGSRIRDERSILAPLRQRRCAKETLLKLGIVFEHDESAYAVHLTLDRVKHELKDASLFTLDLTLDCRNLHPKTGTITPQDKRRLHELHSYFAELDVRRLLTELILAVRTLRKVTVQLLGHPTREDVVRPRLDYTTPDNLWRVLCSSCEFDSRGDWLEEEEQDSDQGHSDDGDEDEDEDSVMDDEDDLSDGYQTECEV